MKTADEQLNLLVQGCETVVTRDELKKKLEQKRALRVKLGCDRQRPICTLATASCCASCGSFRTSGTRRC